MSGPNAGHGVAIANEPRAGGGIGVPRLAITFEGACNSREGCSDSRSLFAAAV